MRHPLITGRLLNRFTKDMEAIDVTVSGVVSMTLTTFVLAVLSVVVIVVVSPLSILAVLPLGYVYYKVQVSRGQIERSMLIPIGNVEWIGNSCVGVASWLCCPWDMCTTRARLCTLLAVGS